MAFPVSFLGKWTTTDGSLCLPQYPHMVFPFFWVIVNLGAIFHPTPEICPTSSDHLLPQVGKFIAYQEYIPMNKIVMPGQVKCPERQSIMDPRKETNIPWAQSKMLQDTQMT